LALEPIGQAGVVDFAGAVLQNLTDRQMTCRISDHFPRWYEFSTDRSTAALAQVPGPNPDEPDPFRAVQD
jgi:hypothetical protein